MSTTGIEVFDTTLQETNHWLKLVTGGLGTESRRNAFGALRGAYYEGWHPAATPTRERHLADFVDHVANELSRDSQTNPAEAAQACFAMMSQCLDRGEMLKLKKVLPHEALNLGPDTLLRK